MGPVMYLEAELIECLLEALAVELRAGSPGKSLKAVVINKQIVSLRMSPHRIVISPFQVSPNANHVIRC